MRLGLRAKYALQLVGIVALVMALLSGGIIHQFQRGISRLTGSVNDVMETELVSQLEDKGAFLVQTLAESLVNPTYFLDLRKIQELLQPVLAQDDVVYVYLLGPQGRVITDGTQENPMVDQVLTDPVSQRATRGQVFVVQRQPDLIDLSHPIVLGDQVLGWIRIALSTRRILDTTQAAQAQTVRMIHDSRNQIFALSGLVAMAVCILGIVASVLVADRLVRPIRALRDATGKVGRGEFSQQVAVTSKDELGDLTRSFNQMAQDLTRLIEAEKTLSATAVAAEAAQRARAEELERAYTQLRSTQAQLIQAEKLAGMGQVAAGVAHEVKNPLGTILMGLDYLKASRKLEQDAQLADVLQMMADGVARANQIIHRLLDLARPLTLSLKPELMSEVVRSALKLVKQQGALEGIEVACECAEDSARVLLDRTQFQQVLINLIENAVHAMPQGGRLTLKTYVAALTELTEGVGRRATDLFRPDEQAMICEVTDTGAGISKGNLQKIFEPFFTTKPKGQGTGLGLAIVRSIIQAHRGLIRVASEEGKGATFTLTLPLARS